VNALNPDVQAMVVNRLDNICVSNYFDDGVTVARNYKVTWTSLPNVQLLNDKRYEIKWLEYIHGLNVSSYDVIIADRISAEAMLRYAEGTNKMKMSESFIGSLVLIDCPDIYTAGERHGREFRTSCISRHCASVNLIATNEQAYKEACNLKRQFANDAMSLLFACNQTKGLSQDKDSGDSSELLETIKAVIASLHE